MREKGPGAGFRVLSRVDGLADRVFTSRYNPLYHSGAITVALLLVLLVTGLYLLLFYRLGSPYASVASIHDQAWSGRWVRSVHRYATDAALVAAGIHGLRMYVQRRTWGPRALAWLSGLALVAVLLVCGWTGYVLVWDAHAQLLAVEGARWLDALPIFSEPISRSFTGERPLPSGFFFVNLFAHIALPLSIGVLVWVHVARLARPVLLPVRPVLWGVIGALAVLSLAWPAPLPAGADLLRIPSGVPTDLFFGFWLPLTQGMPAWAVWLAIVCAAGAAASVPWLTRPRVERLPAPAVVNERTCTGCEQCVHDCPYDAIEMIARTDGRATLVARVKSDLCTACGICIGSCPPMSIGPMQVTGRDQLADVRAFLEREKPGARDVVIVGCAWSAASAEAERSGARLFTVPCAGAVHSSTVEMLVRGGAGGVLVVGCIEHDGRTREGVTWTAQRLFGGRRAELKERVDRRRVRLVQASLTSGVQLHAAVRAFEDEIAAFETEESAPDVVALCRGMQVSS